MTRAKPLPPIYPSDEARFLELVERNGPDACWPFAGGLCHGYGYFRLGKRKVRAHRVAWVLWSGEDEPDPDLQLDHRCHDPKECRGVECEHRRCCNPAHMRPVTSKENIANSFGRPAQLREREKCPSGHPWDKKNTRHWVNEQGHTIRLCRACQNEQRKARIARKGKRLDLDTHCVHGHPWVEGSFSLQNGKTRICRVCANEKSRAYKARKRATAASQLHETAA